MGAECMRTPVLVAVLALLLLALLLVLYSPTTTGVESYASADDIAKVRALMYHLEWKHRSCGALRRMVAPIALAGSCDVPDSTIADAIPVAAISPQTRNTIAPLVKAQCRSFPGGVSGFLEAVESCA